MTAFAFVDLSLVRPSERRWASQAELNGRPIVDSESLHRAESAVVSGLR